MLPGKQLPAFSAVIQGHVIGLRPMEYGWAWPDQITFISGPRGALHGPLRFSSPLTILEDGKPWDPPASNIRSTFIRMKNTVVLDPWELGLSVTAVRLSWLLRHVQNESQVLPQNKFPISGNGTPTRPNQELYSPPELILQAYLTSILSPGHSRLTTLMFPWTRRSASALRAPSVHCDSCLLTALSSTPPILEG